MPCYHPIKGIMTSIDGKIKFLPSTQFQPHNVQMTVPCGRCIGCREAYSKMWAIRCVHEIQMHEQSCFLTLTYSTMPKNGSLIKDHLKNFLKHYRKWLSRKYPGTKIRYFACGEYGEKLSRPHFHLLIFGHDFHDKEFLTSILTTSPSLKKLWKHGFHSIGEANFQTAAYIARYVVKKVSGSAADKHYQNIDLDTGEITPILGEYSTMSNRPGIGYDWYQKYKTDVYPSDEIIHEGHHYPVPRYYDKLCERDNPKLFEQVKKARTAKFEQLDPKEFHFKRLIAKEACKQAKITLHLQREYEKETNS